MMGIPQCIFIVLVCMGLGMSLAKHGETETETVSFWKALYGKAVLLALLWWGGFFN